MARAKRGFPTVIFVHRYPGSSSLGPFDGRAHYPLTPQDVDSGELVGVYRFVEVKQVSNVLSLISPESRGKENKK